MAGKAAKKAKVRDLLVREVRADYLDLLKEAAFKAGMTRQVFIRERVLGDWIKRNTEPA